MTSFNNFKQAILQVRKRCTCIFTILQIVYNITNCLHHIYMMTANLGQLLVLTLCSLLVSFPDSSMHNRFLWLGHELTLVPNILYLYVFFV